jgi:DNA-binding beta-propeller fold protein YncE
MKRRLTAIALALGAASCGGSSAKLTVNLKSTSDPLLTPYQAAVGIAKVRVSILGPDLGANETAILDLKPDEKTASFSDLKNIKSVDVRVEGFDADGRLVAFGRASSVSLASDATVEVPFRRNLAYVTHKPHPKMPKASSTIYIFDVASRTYAGSVQIPNGGIGRGVSAKGGDGFLINYDRNGQGFLGFLSSDDHQWTEIALKQVQDKALGVTGSALVASAGGGKVSIVDLSKKMVVAEFDIGGTVTDAAISDDGKRGVIIVNTPGMVVVDLTDPCLAMFNRNQCLKNIMANENPSGVAIGADGHTAYVTSSGGKTVAQLDLASLQGRKLNVAAFPGPVGAATYADDANTIVALSVGPDGAPHVFSYVTVPRGTCPPTNPCDGLSLGLDAEVNTLLYPVDIASDPSGHRVMVIEAGTSTASSGLTVIETRTESAPGAAVINIDVLGSTGLYPLDPTDTVTEGERTVHNRYQPFRFAIAYGR